MTKEEILKEYGIVKRGMDYAPSETRYSDIVNAMQDYAKPLAEALILALNYLQSDISINPRSGIHNTIEKALQDYNKK